MSYMACEVDDPTSYKVIYHRDSEPSMDESFGAKFLPLPTESIVLMLSEEIES